ncbi:MAG: AI-2E family transporter [Flavobacteriales bacterium]|nr:AI-2E family transporter [Flavobacteriales bacterium]MCB9166366.1 AI-2E family transporter [Flavobacteriales bacterium]
MGSDDRLIKEGARPLDNILRVLALFGLLAWCVLLLAPFFTVMAWGAIIAVTVAPFHQWMTRALRGRKRWAAAVVMVVGVAVLVLPGYLLTDDLLQGVRFLRERTEQGPITLPSPSPWVADIPLVGNGIERTWSAASQDLTKALGLIGPELTRAGRWFLESIGRFGLGLLEFIAALLVAAVLLANDTASARLSKAALVRIAGARGHEFAEVAERTVRNVALGVLGVAIVQAVLAGIGFALAGVPAAALLTVVCLFLSILQIGMFPVFVPVAIYMFYSGDLGPAIALAIWLLLVGLVDNILRPILMGRNAPAPMVVVFLGAIGGFILSGLVGMFVGAVILSLGYRLFAEWVDGTPVPSDDQGV